MPTTARVRRVEHGHASAGRASRRAAAPGHLRSLPRAAERGAGRRAAGARSASRRTSSREFTSSSRVGTLPTSWTTEQAGRRGRCSTIACSVRPHEMPSTSAASRVSRGRRPRPGPAARARSSSGPVVERTTTALRIPCRPRHLVAERQVQLRERVDLDPDDAVAERVVEQAGDPEARDAQLRGDLALAGPVEVVAPAASTVLTRCRRETEASRSMTTRQSLGGDHTSVKRSNERSWRGPAQGRICPVAYRLGGTP